MTRPNEELNAKILALPIITRAMLAEKLLESFEDDHDSEIDWAWVEEVEK